MEYKTNLKYFEKSLIPIIIGVPMALVGAAQIFFHVFGYWWQVTNILTVVMVLGLLMVLFFLVSSTKGRDLDKTVAKKISHLTETAGETVLSHDKYAKIMDTYVAESYVFGNENSDRIKKGGDGTYRTNYYTASAFVITNKKLFIYSLSFSLLKDFEEDSFKSFDYDDIDEVYMEEGVYEHDLGKKTARITTHSLNIKAGGKLFSFPAGNDSLMDETVNKILLRKEKNHSA